jgi:hypothetical protein
MVESIVSLLILSLSLCQKINFAILPKQNFKLGLNTRTAEEYSHFCYDGKYLVFTSDIQGKRRNLIYDFQGYCLLLLPVLNKQRSS